MDYDRVLIEQSIATQYGILPSAQGELAYPEWAKLVAGLMDDTPLGRVVAVRGEENTETLRNMNATQKRLRAEWQRHLAKRELKTKTPEQLRGEMLRMEQMLAKAFG